MQGLFIGGRRPKSKKEIKDLVKAGDISRIRIEGTSLHGNDYDGPLSDAPLGKRIDVVGPDPYNSRKFYLNITRTDAGIKVT